MVAWCLHSSSGSQEHCLWNL